MVGRYPTKQVKGMATFEHTNPMSLRLLMESTLALELFWSISLTTIELVDDHEYIASTTPEYISRGIPTSGVSDFVYVYYKLL